MFLSRNKKNNVYPCKHQFFCIKVGLKVSKLYRYVFVMPWLKELIKYYGYFLKGNAIQVVSISWSKMLNKPFILMQEFSKSA